MGQATSIAYPVEGITASVTETLQAVENVAGHEVGGSLGSS
jgi:hypothetical protein